jgi:hypothetical protein
MNSAGPSEPSRTAEHEDQAALRLVAVALLVHMLRSRRFWERLAFSAVVVGALARIGEENGAGTLARLEQAAGPAP